MAKPRPKVVPRTLTVVDKVPWVAVEHDKRDDHHPDLLALLGKDNIPAELKQSWAQLKWFAAAIAECPDNTDLKIWQTQEQVRYDAIEDRARELGVDPIKCRELG